MKQWKENLGVLGLTTVMATIAGTGIASFADNVYDAPTTGSTNSVWETVKDKVHQDTGLGWRKDSTKWFEDRCEYGFDVPRESVVSGGVISGIWTGTLTDAEGKHGTVAVTVDTTTGKVTTDKTGVQGLSPEYPFGTDSSVDVGAMGGRISEYEQDNNAGYRTGDRTDEERRAITGVRAEPVVEQDLVVTLPCYEFMGKADASVTIADPTTQDKITFTGTLTHEGVERDNELREWFAVYESNPYFRANVA